MDHMILSPDDLVPGVRMETGPFLVDLMAEYKTMVF